MLLALIVDRMVVRANMRGGAYVVKVDFAGGAEKWRDSDSRRAISAL